MQTKFIAILNQEIALPKSLNALAHMSFGMGHRISGKPNVNIFFGTAKEVREFRTSAKAHHVRMQTGIFSDFPHTMVGRSTEDLLQNVIKTPEKDVTYFGSCYLGTEIPSELLALTSSCSQFKDYKPFSASADTTLLAAQVSPDVDDPALSNMKISMLLNSKFTLAQSLNEIVLAALEIGNKIPHSRQRLLNIAGMGEDAYALTNISFHSLAVVTTGKPYEGMRTNVAKDQKLTVSISDSVTAAFGTKTDVEKIILPRSTRLYAENLKDGDLVSATASPEKKELKTEDPVIGSNQNFFQTAKPDATSHTDSAMQQPAETKQILSS